MDTILCALNLKDTAAIIKQFVKTNRASAKV